jgi:hypothetical protein
MHGARTVLTVAISVVATYAVMSAWPALKALNAPATKSQPAVTAPATVTAPPAPPQLPAAVVGSPAPPPSGTALAATPPANPVAQRRTARRNTRNNPPIDFSQMSADFSYGAYDNSKVKYARRTVILLGRPGGVPLIPSSLNKAPLTVLRGTRLLPMREEGKWVMVQSPSGLMGWTKTTELTATRPIAPDHYDN